MSNRFSEALHQILQYKKTLICVAIGVVVVPELIRWLARRRRPVTYEDLPADQVKAINAGMKQMVSRHCTYCHCFNRSLVKVDAPNQQHPVCSSAIFVHEGLQNLIKAICLWEKACECAEQININDGEMVDNLTNSLETVIRASYNLCDLVNRLLIFCPTLAKPIPGLRDDSRESFDVGYDVPEHPMSVLSDDTYMTALEEDTWTTDGTEPLFELPNGAISPVDLPFYRSALVKAECAEVPYRKLRTVEMNCRSDEDFLAKLYCVRKCTKVLFDDPEKCRWLAAAVKGLIGIILSRASQSLDQFHAAYDRLIGFSYDANNLDLIYQELKDRKVPVISFYDIVSDFIIFDSLEEMRHPPGTILAILNNRLLPGSTKRKVIGSIATSVVSSKRDRLKTQNGFLKLFYDLLETLAPTFAWSMLGSDDVLRQLFGHFKEQVVAFHMDMFNMDVVCYMDVHRMAEDVWTVCQRRVQLTMDKLNERDPALQNSFPVNL